MSEWGTKDFANNEPKYLQTNWPGNTNLYLVNASRLANASFGGGEAVAHQGWVKINQGTGFVSGIAVSNVNSSIYSNTYLTIAGANTTPANAQMVVLNGNNISVVVNVKGAGYANIPTVTAAGSNNTTLVFSVTPGGRMGRIQPETLVALSQPIVTDANSGGTYFPGA